MGYRRGTLLFALLGIVLVAGCSDVSHPSALGTASEPATPSPPRVAVTAPVSQSPSSTESSTAPVASPISGTPTSSGSGNASPPTSVDVIAMHVRATARAYIDDFNIALATGDVTKIEELTSPTCGCRSLVNKIKQMSAAGDRYDGVVFTIKSIEVAYLAAGTSGDVKYSISAGRILNAAGTELNTTIPVPDQENDLFITSSNGRWTVQQSYLLGVNNQ